MAARSKPMSQSVTAIPAKKRRARSPSVAKPAFILIQILDEDGKPTEFSKKRINIVSVERSAEKIMEMLEDGNHPHALYLRVVVPVARTGAPRTPKDQAA